MTDTNHGISFASLIGGLLVPFNKQSGRGERRGEKKHGEKEREGLMAGEANGSAAAMI